ncbi:MAG: transcriptional repressor LexA [Thermaerobacter sp.]|nr:transcriptional repressor LexA [Thermaerobacter sp.]
MPEDDHALTQRILGYIRQQIVLRGYPPSIREIGDAVGLRSTASVHRHLSHLEGRGVLRRAPSKPRAIEILNDPLVAARGHLVPVARSGQLLADEGFPDPRAPRGLVFLPRDLVGSGQLYLLEMPDDDLHSEGIHAGDQLILQRQSRVGDGDLAVFLLLGSLRVRRVHRERNRSLLVAADPARPPISRREVQVVGKVVGLIRRLG